VVGHMLLGLRVWHPLSVGNKFILIPSRSQHEGLNSPQRKTCLALGAWSANPTLTVCGPLGVGGFPPEVGGVGSLSEGASTEDF
jgi:hypothetical protein